MPHVAEVQTLPNENQDGHSRDQTRLPRWSMGILNDPATHDVPGSVVLLSEKTRGSCEKNNTGEATERHVKKKTSDGRIILEPQPEDSCNDPLNWPAWKKDVVLVSVGFFAMVGGGMTPLLAAGFYDVAKTFDIGIAKVSLTTGLYMMGLGIGSVITSPTAILFGKRPVYITGAIIFVCSSIWCALSTSFTSLILGRMLQGISISPTECLPSATITEVFFLHERAYRIGIYSLLLLGGKNLVPVASAFIIDSLGWRWVFWISLIAGVLCVFLVFFFVPETFWNRCYSGDSSAMSKSDLISSGEISNKEMERHSDSLQVHSKLETADQTSNNWIDLERSDVNNKTPLDLVPKQPVLSESLDSPNQTEKSFDTDNSSKGIVTSNIPKESLKPRLSYSADRRSRPRTGYVEQLKPWNGRLANESWLQVAARPFVLYAYPAVLWSAIVYACSIGWLIAISESITLLFRTRATYGFSALSAGLIYFSPFIGGVIGTAIAGKASDFIVQAMTKRNKNLYEPEFRLVMAIPVTFTTVIGLMGLGWSVEIVDSWIVPTLFFGIISFGCSLGAATAITYCVDCYHEYAGEAMVTLNFCKNMMHGLIFSLFINQWIEINGPKIVFVRLGIIQLVVMLTGIPMYIYGKRARMWTSRKRLMKRFCDKKSERR